MSIQCKTNEKTNNRLFLKSFIFMLGDDWTEVTKLQKTFEKYCVDLGEGSDELNPAQAGDLLQKLDATRTALERRSELEDIDLDNNDQIAYIELLLLLYKVPILREYYKRHGTTPSFDLGEEATGVGITGVGEELLDELFYMPSAMPPELEAAIETFMAQKREREERIASLEAMASAGGVKGLTAKNELEQMMAADLTEMNRMELTLDAARRKALKNGGSSGDAALAEKRKKAEEEEAAKRAASRARMAARAAMFE